MKDKRHIIKFLPVERAIEAMSKAELYDFMSDKQFWPLQLTIDGKDYSIVSVHLTKGGAEKAARKLSTYNPNNTFIALGTGWEYSTALYTHPPNPETVASYTKARTE